MRADEWGKLITESLSGSLDARERAVVALVSDREQIAALAPLEFKGPESWVGEEGQRKRGFIDGIRQVSGIEAVREKAGAWPHAFGEWRRSAADWEAANAAKLTVLLWIVQTLHRMHEREQDPRFDKLKYKVQEFIYRRWGISELPVTGPYREWCVSATRDTRLMPNSWRYA